MCCDMWLKGNIPSNVLSMAKEAINRSGMTIVDSVVHKFDPQGITAVYVLAESHFIIHTYPEANYLSIDCYTCGKEGDPLAAIMYIVDNIEYLDYKISDMVRGKNGTES
jgi:S-adenosylmethionine decarboxylase